MQGPEEVNIEQSNKLGESGNLEGASLDLYIGHQAQVHGELRKAD